jgi:cysteine desulfurase/selenocysteine lyase
LSPQRIYLDNAATTWPKPESVYVAVDRYQRENGAAAGRSAYSEAGESRRIVDQARLAVSRLIGAADPSCIVFTANGSDALNLAIHGLLQRGDHVVCTAAEHNSVLRPLRACQDDLGVEVTQVPCDASGRVAAGDVRQAIQPNTRLVAMLHASNVTGAIQPVAEVGKLCRQRGIPFLVDAAQSIGHLPLSVDDVQADLLAAPGHKGLLGPLGTGLLYIRAGIESQLRTVRQGGTGSNSESDLQPESLPDKYETGNLNVPGIAGLAAGIRWLEARGISAIREHEQTLTQQLRSGLSGINGVVLHGPKNPADCVGVVSVTIERYDPQEAAALLDSAFRVQVRAGLHCAPQIHKSIGTFSGGGTVRFSIGPLNTADDIESAIDAVKEIT